MAEAQTPPAPLHLRVFLSSLGDVADERGLARVESGAADALLISKLNRLVHQVRLLGKLVERYFASGQAALLSVDDQIDTHTAPSRRRLHLWTCPGSVDGWPLGSQSRAWALLSSSIGER